VLEASKGVFAVPSLSEWEERGRLVAHAQVAAEQRVAMERILNSCGLGLGLLSVLSSLAVLQLGDLASKGRFLSAECLLELQTRQNVLVELALGALGEDCFAAFLH